MKKIDWDKFKSDKEILEFLKGFPRYKNTPLKSIFRRIMFLVSIIYCRISGLNKPLFVILVTNNSCNLKCIYSYGHYGDRKHKDYTTKEFVKIIDELKDLGTRLITLHGGESLLRKDMGEIFNYVKHKGVYVSFNTNGYLVPKKIDEIRCVDAVCLSLDGSEANNDKNRGAGCYKKVLEALDILKENNIPTTISATLTRHSMHDVEYLAELGRKKNVKVQYHILYKGMEFRNKCSEIVLNDKEIRNTVKLILNLKKKKYPVYWSENVLDTAINWPHSLDKTPMLTKDDVKGSNKNCFIPCYHGKLKYFIDADGRVITCWDNDDPKAPNIKNKGVARAIKTCFEINSCMHCAFLANNEHNALMDLNFKTIINIVRTQISETLKIGGR